MSRDFQRGVLDLFLLEQYVRVRQTNGPYVHSKDIFHYWRFCE